MKYYYDANRQDSSLYQKWNATTKECFKNNMICKNCSNKWICQMNWGNSNKYHIKQVKFATLMTYANIGKPKGESNDTDN